MDEFAKEQAAIETKASTPTTVDLVYRVEEALRKVGWVHKMGRFYWLWPTKLVRWGAMSLGGPLGRGLSNKAGTLSVLNEGEESLNRARLSLLVAGSFWGGGEDDTILATSLSSGRLGKQATFSIGQIPINNRIGRNGIGSEKLDSEMNIKGILPVPVLEITGWNSRTQPEQEEDKKAGEIGGVKLPENAMRRRTPYREKKEKWVLGKRDRGREEGDSFLSRLHPNVTSPGKPEQTEQGRDSLDCLTRTPHHGLPNKATTAASIKLGTRINRSGKEGNASPNKKTDSLSYSARRLASRFRELLTSG
ncbi:hypothetical protein Acr_00g0002860 [Actinidia rufa]|uniref:Uncharacterized protein n=1 Tax=Actinidia rufa TaxID=165716 RepID=A0A7J0D6Z0_9ERIC|nr:hypothetical protein Acr_00g0002860 [Actinidia rufa]